MARARPSLLIILLLSLVAAVLAVTAASGPLGDEGRELGDVLPLGGDGGSGNLVIQDLEVDVTVSSWSWGVSNLGALGGGGGGGAGKAEFSPFVVVKSLDKASPKLVRAVATGEHIPAVVFTAFRPGTTRALGVYTMTDVIISGVDQIGKGKTTESVSFNFSKIEFQAGGSTICWDVPANASC